MKFITRLLFVVAIFGVQNIKAKAILSDSGNVIRVDTNNTKPAYNQGIQKMAVKDTRAFKLSPEQKTQLKQGLIPKTSDYFKPTAEYCANPEMLKDSTYVREFREAAYHRAGHHSGGRVIFVALGVIAAFGALFALAYVTFGAK